MRTTILMAPIVPGMLRTGRRQRRSGVSPLTEKDGGTLVIGVMVPGEPYSQEAEHRRRTRFALKIRY